MAVPNSIAEGGAGGGHQRGKGNARGLATCNVVERLEPGLAQDGHRQEIHQG